MPHHVLHQTLRVPFSAKDTLQFQHAGNHLASQLFSQPFHINLALFIQLQRTLLQLIDPLQLDIDILAALLHHTSQGINGNRPTLSLFFLGICKQGVHGTCFIGKAVTHREQVGCQRRQVIGQLLFSRGKSGHHLQFFTIGKLLVDDVHRGRIIEQHGDEPLVGPVLGPREDRLHQDQGDQNDHRHAQGGKQVPLARRHDLSLQLVKCKHGFHAGSHQEGHPPGRPGRLEDDDLSKELEDKPAGSRADHNPHQPGNDRDRAGFRKQTLPVMASPPGGAQQDGDQQDRPDWPALGKKIGRLCYQLHCILMPQELRTVSSICCARSRKLLSFSPSETNSTFSSAPVFRCLAIHRVTKHSASRISRAATARYFQSS